MLAQPSHCFVLLSANPAEWTAEVEISQAPWMGWLFGSLAHAKQIFVIPLSSLGHPHREQFSPFSSLLSTFWPGKKGVKAQHVIHIQQFHVIQTSKLLSEMPDSSRNGIFRRAQSLRYPRSSGKSKHCVFAPKFPLNFQPIAHRPLLPAGVSRAADPVPLGASHPVIDLVFSGKQCLFANIPLGSIEAQSLLGRLSASQRLALVCTWRQIRNQQNQLMALMRKILMDLEQSEPTVKEVILSNIFSLYL